MRDPRVRREAEALADAGWEVDVICLRAPNEPATGEPGGSIHIQRVPLQHKRGSKVRYVLEYAAFFVLASALLTRKHIRRRYDLVHIHTMPDALVFAAWLPKLTGTPIVLDIHDPVPEMYQARFGISPGHWLNRALMLEERASFSFADHIITTHDLTASLFVRSAPAAKFSPVMNVPDPRIFRKTLLPKRALPRRFTLIYTGTVTPAYGLDVVIHAVAKLRQAIPDLCLRIVGEGDDLERLKELAANLRLADHIEFLPPVPLDRIPEVLAAADVCVSPHRRDATSPWGFSTKLVEALLLGLPVISARTEAISCYFDDTMVAYAEPENADEFASQIVRLYRDPALGAQMVTNAKKFLGEHSWECERARFYHVIEGLEYARL